MNAKRREDEESLPSLTENIYAGSENFPKVLNTTRVGGYENEPLTLLRIFAY